MKKMKNRMQGRKMRGLEEISKTTELETRSKILKGVEVGSVIGVCSGLIAYFINQGSEPPKTLMDYVTDLCGSGMLLGYVGAWIYYSYNSFQNRKSQ